MILLSPFSRNVGENPSPKNYPYWERLIEYLREQFPDEKLVQLLGNLDEQQFNCDVFYYNKDINELIELIKECKFWVSVDNFFPHLCSITDKKGFVIFAYSDPKIFGYSNNINILKSEGWLRKDQYVHWGNVKSSADAFEIPSKIIEIIKNNI